MNARNPSATDVRVLGAARSVRGLAAGALSVVLAEALGRAGFGPLAIGILLGVAMGSAAGWAIVVPGGYSGLSRRTLFLIGAGAVALGGLLLWADLASPVVVVAALLLGGIVAGGSDISPLGALEQGALAGAVKSQDRTSAFAWYNLAGYIATAAGAFVAGALGTTALAAPGLPAAPHPVVLLFYGLLGAALVPAYLALSDPGGPQAARGRPLSPEHRRPILRLSLLFTVDAFGGGMFANALVAYFLVLRFGAPLEVVGIVLGAANVAAGLSLLLAVPLARRFGLVNTMVFTHIPSNVLVIGFAFAPTLPIATALWVVRSTLSQMDVPTRQSYTQALVPPEEGAAAAGYTTAARSAQALGAPVTGLFLAAGGPWLAGPFALAGSVKIAYDLALYGAFRRVRPPEERTPPRPSAPPP
jgi:hypothetical protein